MSRKFFIGLVCFVITPVFLLFFLENYYADSSSENYFKQNKKELYELTQQQMDWYGVEGNYSYIRLHEVKKGDNLAEILSVYDNITAGNLQQIVRSVESVVDMLRLKVGREVVLLGENDKMVDILIYQINLYKYLIIPCGAPQNYSIKTIKTKERLAVLRGSVNESSSLMKKLAYIYRSQIDFFQSSPLDSFEIVVREIVNMDGVVGRQIIEAANVTYGNNDYFAVRYLLEGEYFYMNEQGYSLTTDRYAGPLDYGAGYRVDVELDPPIVYYSNIPTGVPVYSIADGTVEKIFYALNTGHTIEVNHGDYTSVYTHLQSPKLKIKEQSKVKKGTVIGFVGSSGKALKPLLSFTMKMNLNSGGVLTTSYPVISLIGNDFQRLRSKVKSMRRLLFKQGVEK